MAIKEEWQTEIVARDLLAAQCRISELANLLYPETPLAADREARLYADGGEIIQRIARLSKQKASALRAELTEWRESAAA